MAIDTLILNKEAEAFSLRLDALAEAAKGPGSAYYADQLRRAGDSVASNIVEGYGRGVSRSCLNHLAMSYASLMECESHLRRGMKRGTWDREAVEEATQHLIRVRYLLIRYRQSVERRLSGRRPNPAGRCALPTVHNLPTVLTVLTLPTALTVLTLLS